MELIHSDGQLTRKDRLKIKFVRGIMFFYIVNLAALWIGMIGVKLLGNRKGMIAFLINIHALNMIAGYVTLKIH